MSSSATGVGMPICFLGAILLILTQKSSQKFGDVLGIGDRRLLAKLELIIFILLALRPSAFKLFFAILKHNGQTLL